jgi:hypothetical protein
MSVDFDNYEEEMMRLASEISMVENLSELDDFDRELEWNPQNLDETEETIRIFEEIVDEHLICSENANYIESSEDEGFGEPLSAAQMKDIYMMNDNSNDFDTQSNKSAASSYSDSFSPRSSAFGSAVKSEAHSRVNSTKKDQNFNRRPSGRGRDQKIKDTVTTISSKLRWYQNKIAQTIESTSEVNWPNYSNSTY